MEDKTFNLKGINIVNDILSYFYLGLLIMCFILALGNRPQGSKWGYTTAFIGFALITIYMTVCIYSSFVSLGSADGSTLYIDIGVPVSVQRHPSLGEGSWPTAYRFRRLYESDF